MPKGGAEPKDTLRANGKAAISRPAVEEMAAGFLRIILYNQPFAVLEEATEPCWIGTF
jgi:hypothetical protein